MTTTYSPPKRRVRRVLAGSGLAIALALGGTVAAAPASAIDVGNSLSCPISTRVHARGTWRGTGVFSMRAGNNQAFSINWTQTASSGVSNAVWRVWGAGASSGIGFCG